MRQAASLCSLVIPHLLLKIRKATFRVHRGGRETISENENHLPDWPLRTKHACVSLFVVLCDSKALHDRIPKGSLLEHRRLERARSHVIVASCFPAPPFASSWGIETEPNIMLWFSSTCINRFRPVLAQCGRILARLGQLSTNVGQCSMGLGQLGPNTANSGRIAPETVGRLPETPPGSKQNRSPLPPAGVA